MQFRIFLFDIKKNNAGQTIENFAKTAGSKVVVGSIYVVKNACINETIA